MSEILIFGLTFFVVTFCTVLGMMMALFVVKKFCEWMGEWI